MKKIVFALGLMMGVCRAENCDFISYGRCLSCDTPIIIKTETSDVCTDHCPNRQARHYNGPDKGDYVICSLKECSKEFPLRDALGGCHACDAVEKKSATNDLEQFAAYENCEVCENRYRDIQGFCQFKDGTEVPIWGEYEDRSVAQDLCNKDGFFEDDDEKCYSCLEAYPIRIWKKELVKQHDEKCPNRTLVYDFWSLVSVIKCPKERPLMDRYGNCWRCDEKTPVDFDNNENICGSIRYKHDGMSYLCPERKLYLTQEQCQSCAGVWENEICH